MSVTVQILMSNAMIENGIWSSKDRTLKKFLDSLKPLYGSEGADPNPDLTAAQEAVNLTGGAIINIDQNYKFDPEVIY